MRPTPGHIGRVGPKAASRERLIEVGNLIKKKPKKLEELPKEKVKSVGPLSESEDEAEVVAEDPEVPGFGESGLAPGSGVEEAIRQLTQIAAKLSEKPNKKESLETILDGGGGLGSSSESSSLPGSRKNSAALRALQRCLRENPKYLFQTIEARLQADFQARSVQPGEPFAAGTTVRGWLAGRSRTQNFTNLVRWSWQVGGIWDCLIQGKHDEARARCALLINPASMPEVGFFRRSASWRMRPPYHAFSSHQTPSAHEMQHSALTDARWAEVYLGHLKEIHAFSDAKRKLGGRTDRSGGGKEEEPNPKSRPKNRAKPKPENKNPSQPSSGSTA